MINSTVIYHNRYAIVWLILQPNEQSKFVIRRILIPQTDERQIMIHVLQLSVMSKLSKIESNLLYTILQVMHTFICIF